MSLFKRIKNIIKSNINFQKEIDVDIDIDMNQYEDLYFQDSKEIQEDNSIDKKYYKILELEYGADFKEIKRAYKKLLKKYHPDLYANNPQKLEKAQKLTKILNEAYTYFERKMI